MTMRLAHLFAPLLLLAAFAGAPAQAGNNNPDPEGYVDTTFGGEGIGWRHVYSSGTVDERAIDVARLPDGTYITLIAVPGGTSGSKIGLQRFNADGTLYGNTFGNGGKVVKDAGLVDVTGLMVDAAGRILVIGNVPGAGGLKDFAALRFLANGSDDASFGSGGKAVVDFDIGGARDERPIAIAEQQLGASSRYVILGNCSYNTPQTPAQMCLLGLTPTGAPDPAFGNLFGHAGRSTLAFAGTSPAYAAAITVTPGNLLLVAGTTVLNDTDTDAAACLFSDSGLSYEGGSNCRNFSIDLPGAGGSLYDGATALAMDGPDRAILAGDASNRMFALRLVVDTDSVTLSKDNTFIGAGTPARANVFIGDADRNAHVADVIVRPRDGMILLAGSIIDVSGRVGAVQRIEPDGTQPQLFGGLLGYRAKTLSQGTAFSTLFVSILLDGNRPVLFGTAPDNTASDTDLDGVLTRLVTSLPLFEDGFE